MAVLRLNFNSYEAGEEYINRLADESDRNFRLLLALLSSYWRSTIDGPNYARHLKSSAIALAQLRLSLDDLMADGSYQTTRSEYLYQTLTSLLFPAASGAPQLNSTDVEFRDFLNEVIKLYFAGSIPDSVKKAVELVTKSTVIVRECFEEGRKPGSGYDISDEFAMDIDVILPSPSTIDNILADRNIRLILRLIRPAHTLFRTRYIIQDSYLGAAVTTNGATSQKMTDSLKLAMSTYSYEDFRTFVYGVEGIDSQGSKTSKPVVGEDHTEDF